MQELIQMYTYYDRMAEYYDFKPLETEADVAKYHQFKLLRDAVGREIEAMVNLNN